MCLCNMTLTLNEPIIVRVLIQNGDYQVQHKRMPDVQEMPNLKTGCLAVDLSPLTVTFPGRCEHCVVTVSR